jgi:glucosamine-6-phosphate deaminase
MALVATLDFDQIPANIYDSSADLGAAAASDLARILQTAIAEQGQAAIIVATGNSQLSFMQSLRGRRDIAWDKTSVFHMDEYLGMPERHPASFRRYVREQLTDFVHPRAFFGIEGDAPDLAAELSRYAALLKEHQPVACVLGIGENGHLAFNDPPADLSTETTIQIVTLDEKCRQQQVGEGHFATFDDVPMQAITLSVPALLQSSHVLAVVPERRKARPVKAALEGPVTADCPASILRTQAHVTLYLDRESASLLQRFREIQDR